MKKFVFLSLLIVNGILSAQNNGSKNFSVNTKIGTAIPVQGSYLKNNWHSGPYLCLDIIKNSNPFNFIAGLDYEFLSLGGDKIQFITPHIGINHNFNLNRINITPSVNLGYSWFNYTFGKDIISVPPIDAQEYQQDGFSVSADLKVSYDISQKVQIGIGDSYLNIFESFGTSTPKPDESKFIGLNRPYISLRLNI